MKPFSGSRYHENNDKAGDNPSCVICGKAVNVTDDTHWITVIHGGAEFGPVDADANDMGHMGQWPIGPECWRRNRRELQQYAFRYNEIS